MGFYVSLTVTFPCHHNDGVAALARKHKETIDYPVEAEQFLEHVAGRSGKNPGSKGGIVSWGATGNYTNVDDFIEALRPFWTDLLCGIDGGPSEYDRILVLSQSESDDCATANEIYRREEIDPLDLIITDNECPFSLR